MALPKQVQDDLKELEELERRMQQPADPEPTESATDTQQATAEAGSAKPAETSAPTQEQPRPDEPSAERHDLADELARWEQRYNSLRGKYDAEVPQLHAQNKQLQEQIDELRSQLRSMQEKAKEPETQRLVTDDDVNSFGEDLIDVQRRVAREVFTEYVTPLQREVERLTGENKKLLEQVDGTSSQVIETRFDTQLRRLVPDFDQVNADQRWVAWLNEVDPVLRAPRRTAAQSAFDAADAEGVAHYVNLFKQSLEQPSAPPQKELERQVAPTRSNASSSKTTPDGKVYTESETQRLFERVAHLNRQGKLDEATKLEAELTAAYIEGRVRG